MLGDLYGTGLPYDGVPTGFGMALAMNMEALDNYSKLTEAQKEELINRSRDAKSKKERERIVNSIGDNGISLSPMDKNTAL